MAAFPLRFSAPERRVCRVELSRIAPNPRQPRRGADEAALRALADSIRRFGLLSPLLLRADGAGGYELIAGERRLRAMRLLGWSHADAIVAGADARDGALIALVENLHREDLHFLDVAEACRRILREQGISQEELAAILGKSPSALANLLRLLRLERRVLACVRQNGLSERHARALLRLDGEDERLRLAREAVQQGLSVRQLEARIEARHCDRRTSPAPPVAALARDSRLVINALRDTVRQLKRIGVLASSRVEPHEGYYDVIVTIRTPQPEEEPPAP